MLFMSEKYDYKTNNVYRTHNILTNIGGFDSFADIFIDNHDYKLITKLDILAVLTDDEMRGFDDLEKLISLKK